MLHVCALSKTICITAAIETNRYFYCNDNQRMAAFHKEDEIIHLRRAPISNAMPEPKVFCESTLTGVRRKFAHAVSN